MEQIQKVVPNRTITEIRNMFNKYTEIAKEKAQKVRKLEYSASTEDSAINKWIRVLESAQCSNNRICDILPRVLKYIALCEKRPNDKDVNLSDCYLALAEVCKGKLTRPLTPATSYFFYENLSRMALYMKTDRIHKQRNFIKRLKSIDEVLKPEIKTYGRRKKTNIILNPMSIPADQLKLNK